MAVVAPMPSASVSTATEVKPGESERPDRVPHVARDVCEPRDHARNMEHPSQSGGPSAQCQMDRAGDGNARCHEWIGLPPATRLEYAQLFFLPMSFVLLVCGDDRRLSYAEELRGQ